MIKSIFKSLYFLKWCPIFETYPLHQFSKFNNFHLYVDFLGKNISNFVPPLENSTTRITIMINNDGKRETKKSIRYPYYILKPSVSSSTILRLYRYMRTRDGWKPKIYLPSFLEIKNSSLSEYIHVAESF